MDQKVKIKKQTKITENLNFETFTKEELIEKVKSLTAHNIQLKNVLAKQTKNAERVAHSQKQTKPFDFTSSNFRHVALHLMYLGWDYKGYVAQEDTTRTIEHHLFEALIKTKLIKDRTTSNYHRCGRTDKGVSSFGQIISIDLRSNHSPADDRKEEINYCKILNRVLPADIQCVAWGPVDETFSARFNCLSRTYRYYFPKGDLNIEQMKEASEKLLGIHDFRNFCKMDVGNGVVEFTRNIMNIKIEAVEEGTSAYDMYVISIQSKAFLWHQIRCIMGILILIGQGKEKPEVIDELLNVEKHPRKPEYSMASEVPLNLHHCEYENITWHYDAEVLNLVTENLKTAWTFNSIKAHMIGGMIETLQEKGEDIKKKCLSDKLINWKCKSYVPLLKRPTCDSLEAKIDHFKKRKRIEVVDDDKI